MTGPALAELLLRLPEPYDEPDFQPRRDDAGGPVPDASCPEHAPNARAGTEAEPATAVSAASSSRPCPNESAARRGVEPVRGPGADRIERMQGWARVVAHAQAWLLREIAALAVVREAEPGYTNTEKIAQLEFLDVEVALALRLGPRAAQALVDDAVTLTRPARHRRLVRRARQLVRRARQLVRRARQQRYLNGPHPSTVQPPRSPTCPCNTWALCKHHHRCKHTPGWRFTRTPDGHATVTTPTGHSYQSAPPTPWD